MLCRYDIFECREMLCRYNRLSKTVFIGIGERLPKRGCPRVLGVVLLACFARWDASWAHALHPTDDCAATRGVR